MKNLLFVIAFVLFVSWGVGYIGYGLEGEMHILLVMSGITFIIRFSLGR